MKRRSLEEHAHKSHTRCGSTGHSCPDRRISTQIVAYSTARLENGWVAVPRTHGVRAVKLVNYWEWTVGLKPTAHPDLAVALA